MPNSVAQDIVTLLSDNALGTIGTDLFGMQWGDGIDAQTLVIETGGVDTENKEQYEQPTFQILVRGAKLGAINTLYATIKSIHEFLIEQPELVTINTTDYLGFEPVSGINPLGRDDNNRFVYSSNYFTYRNPN